MVNEMQHCNAAGASCELDGMREDESVSTGRESLNLIEE